MDKKQTASSEWEAIWRTMTGKIDSEAKRQKICLLSVFALGLLAHGYGLLNFTINHDSLNEFYWTSSTAWKITLGRFMEPVLRYLMGESIVLPWLTGLCGLLFAGLAVCLISNMFSLDKVWENILLAGVCVTNTTVTALIAAYLHDFCGDMLALLLSVCAAWAWTQMREGFSWRYTLLGAACLGVSFGFYQAYLSVTITLLCVDSIAQLLQGTRAENCIRRLLRAIPMGILAMGGYVVCASVLRRICGLEVSEYYDVAGMGKTLPELFHAIREAYSYAWADLFIPNHGAVLPVSSVQGVTWTAAAAVCLCNGVLLLAAVSAVLGAFRRKCMRWPELVLILVLLLAVPGCMMLVSIASTWLHHLTRYGVCLYYLLALVMLRQGRGGSRRQWAAALIVLVILSNVQIANTAYVKKDLERQAAASAMTRVLSRLEQFEGYTYGESKVAMVGLLDQGALQVGAVDQITGLTFGGQITDKEKLKCYLDIVCQYPVNLCSDEQEAEIAATAEFEQMGCFPARDCVAVIDGVVVVKLSDTPAFY